MKFDMRLVKFQLIEFEILILHLYWKVKSLSLTMNVEHAGWNHLENPTITILSRNFTDNNYKISSKVNKISEIHLHKLVRTVPHWISG